jgi:hypothetical protein
VVKAGKEFALLATNELGERITALPAVQVTTSPSGRSSSAMHRYHDFQNIDQAIDPFDHGPELFPKEEVPGDEEAIVVKPTKLKIRKHRSRNNCRIWNQPLGASPRFSEPDASAFRLMRQLFLERC